MSLAQAIKIAVDAHGDTLDRQGRPYILHPLRVMFRVGNDISVRPEDRDTLMMAAVLHDVVEDTRVTLVDLEKLGIPFLVIRIVDALSRRCHGKEKETWNDFIGRLSKYPLAKIIKLADMEDNANVMRQESPITGTSKVAFRLEKYRKTTELLRNDLGVTL